MTISPSWVAVLKSIVSRFFVTANEIPLAVFPQAKLGYSVGGLGSATDSERARSASM